MPRPVHSPDDAASPDRVGRAARTGRRAGRTRGRAARTTPSGTRDPPARRPRRGIAWGHRWEADYVLTRTAGRRTTAPFLRAITTVYVPRRSVPAARRTSCPRVLRTVVRAVPRTRLPRMRRAVSATDSFVGQVTLHVTVERLRPRTRDVLTLHV